MTTLDSLRRTRTLAPKVAGALSFLAPLATRLLMGQAFYQTGEGKIANFANTVTFSSELGIPFPEANAFFVSWLEFWGGLLLVAGLATRLVAGALASTMVVALATADRASLLEAFGGAAERRFARHVAVGGYPAVWRGADPGSLLRDLGEALVPRDAPPRTNSPERPVRDEACPGGVMMWEPRGRGYRLSASRGSDT